MIFSVLFTPLSIYSSGRLHNWRQCLTTEPIQWAKWIKFLAFVLYFAHFFLRYLQNISVSVTDVSVSQEIQQQVQKFGQIKQKTWNQTDVTDKVKDKSPDEVQLQVLRHQQITEHFPFLTR